jgi:hypothetical protein
VTLGPFSRHGAVGPAQPGQFLVVAARRGDLVQPLGQCRVVQIDELGERGVPVAALAGVPAQRHRRLPPAQPDQVRQDVDGEVRAVLIGVDVVDGIEQMAGEGAEAEFEVAYQPRVVQAAVFERVPPGVVAHAVVDELARAGGAGRAARRAAASALQAAVQRFRWVKDDVCHQRRMRTRLQNGQVNYAVRSAPARFTVRITGAVSSRSIPSRAPTRSVR